MLTSTPLPLLAYPRVFAHLLHLPPLPAGIHLLEGDSILSLSLSLELSWAKSVWLEVGGNSPPARLFAIEIFVAEADLVLT